MGRGGVGWAGEGERAWWGTDGGQRWGECCTRPARSALQPGSNISGPSPRPPRPKTLLLHPAPPCAMFPALCPAAPASPAHSRGGRRPAGPCRARTAARCAAARTGAGAAAAGRTAAAGERGGLMDGWVIKWGNTGPAAIVEGIQNKCCWPGPRQRKGGQGRAFMCGVCRHTTHKETPRPSLQGGGCPPPRGSYPPEAPHPHPQSTSIPLPVTHIYPQHTHTPQPPPPRLPTCSLQ